MSDTKMPQVFLGTLVLGIALVVSAYIVAGAVKEVQSSRETITVTGSAKKPIRSDYIVWKGNVSVFDRNMSAAFVKARKYQDQLHAYFRKHDIPDSSITFGSINSRVIYKQIKEGYRTITTDEVKGHRLTVSFTISSVMVNTVTSLSRSVTDLIGQGIPVRSFNPIYHCTKLAELRHTMLQLATRDARRRAEIMVRAAGSEVGVLRSVKMGVFQITPRYSTRVSDYGVNDTSSLEKDIRAVVRLSFTVK
jgi:uncharacterized protein